MTTGDDPRYTRLPAPWAIVEPQVEADHRREIHGRWLVVDGPLRVGETWADPRGSYTPIDPLWPRLVAAAERHRLQVDEFVVEAIAAHATVRRLADELIALARVQALNVAEDRLLLRLDPIAHGMLTREGEPLLAAPEDRL